MKELKENLISFQLFDTGNTGFITREEFRTIMNQLGQYVSLGDINYLVGQIDIDGIFYIFIYYFT